MIKKRGTFKKAPLLFLFSRNPLGIGLLVIGMGIGYFSFEVLNPQWHYSNGSARINVCFTPGGNCTDLIIREIKKAKSSIRIQVYSFTSRPIAEAIIEMAKKGIKVKLLGDKSLLKTPHSVLPLFRENRIPVQIDRVPGIAHNKVVIIDNSTIITGSFNFTNAAEERNSENVLLIHDSEMAKHYLKNWEKRTKNHVSF